MQGKTYNALLDLWFKLSGMVKLTNQYSNNLTNGQFNRTKTNTESHRYDQPIAIMETQSLTQYTPAECHMIFRIMSELKEYNPLWYFSNELKKNTRNSTTVKGLIDKGLLWKTETTGIYIVNPFYIRRGDIIPVVATTLNTLSKCSIITTELITNKRPVSTYIPQTIPNTNQINYYGYAEDNQD
jgi:hypothetical protein